MPDRRFPWTMLVIAVACLSLPRPAEAQLRGFIKKKIAEKAVGTVVGKDSSETAAAAPAHGEARAAAPAGPRFDERVLEMTPANLDKLQAALVAEKAYRDSVEAAFAKMLTPEQYQPCKMKAITSPEAQKLTQHVDYGNTQATQETAQKLLALVAKQCGPEPSSKDKNGELYQAGAHAAEVAGLSPEQYAVLRERLTPFCSGDGGARIPGSGPGIYYVYSETEIAALQPRCAKLMALMPAGAGGRHTKH